MLHCCHVSAVALSGLGSRISGSLGSRVLEGEQAFVHLFRAGMPIFLTLSVALARSGVRAFRAYRTPR